jgi:hypothetical protein
MRKFFSRFRELEFRGTRIPEVDTKQREKRFLEFWPLLVEFLTVAAYTVSMDFGNLDSIFTLQMFPGKLRFGNVPCNQRINV